VDQEAAQELICGDRHDFLLAAVGIVFPAKRDPIILERHQSMVGDGDAVRIAGEIIQNVLGTAERWLGIDDPVLVEELSEKLAKATWLRDSGVSRETGACAEERVASVRLRTCPGRCDSAWRRAGRIVSRRGSIGNRRVQDRHQRPLLERSAVESLQAMEK
jgi:hypothetical protein